MKKVTVGVSCLMLFSCAQPFYDKETSSLANYTKLEREVKEQILRDTQSINCKNNQIIVNSKRTLNEKYREGKNPILATEDQKAKVGLKGFLMPVFISKTEDVESFTDYWEIEKCSNYFVYRIDVVETESGHGLKIKSQDPNIEITSDN